MRRIAVGGMAEVYEARRDGDTCEGCPFVVKVLLPQHARDRELIRTLEHEAQLNKALDHENLVKVVDYGFEGEHPFLVMEKVDGLTLADLQEWLRVDNKRVPVMVAVHIVTDLLRALVYVHEAKDGDGEPLGIVHRDVTPQNVLLSCSGFVRLGDFGIARSNIRDTKTRTGVIKGKLRYLAPEQVTASTIDARTDVYAVGLILYELLTGLPFIRGDNEIQLLRAAEAPEIRLPSSEGANIAFDPVVRGAVGRFPEERFASARRFLETLLAVPIAQGPESAPKILARAVNDALVAGGANQPVGTAPTLASAFGGSRPVPVVVTKTVTPVTPARQAVHTRLVAAGGAVLVALSVWLGLARPWDVSPPRERARGTVDVLGSTTPRAVVKSVPTISPEPGAVRTGPLDPIPVPSVVPRNETKVVPVREVVREPPTKVEPIVVVAPVVDESALQGARSSFAALQGSLRGRGILVEDLDAPARGAMRSAEQTIEGADAEQAVAAVAAAEMVIQNVQVDGEFVRRKLGRVNAAIEAAGQRGADTAELQNLSTAALQDFMEQRYEATNRRLNAILQLLTSPTTL